MIINTRISNVSTLPEGYLYLVPINANLAKSDLDSTTGVYRTYTWSVPAVAGYPDTWISTLSADGSTRTMVVKSGTSVLATYTFNRTYDSEGNLISEVLSS